MNTYISRLRSTLLIALVFATGLAGVARASEIPSIELPTDLQRVLSDYESAWKAGDAPALAALFTPDGFISGPSDWLRGTPAIEKQYANAGGDLRLRALDFSVDGNTGFIVGAYGYGDKAATLDRGRFLLALERSNAEDPWLIAADLDHGNSNEEPSEVIGASEEAEAAPSGQAALPFTMPTPEGWRTETIPFPLEFAPNLPHKGLEELRFAPGMFDAAADDFWSYAFVWWTESDSVFTPESLAKELVDYFQGLATSVAESRGVTPENPTFSAAFEEKPSASVNRTFEGNAETYDAFTTNSQVTLNVVVELGNCTAQARQVAFFLLSPQPKDAEVWTTLRSIREGFRCEPAAS